jgi:hypothetical protein
VFSQEYIPDLKAGFVGALGMQTDLPSRESALRSVRSKADEIAECLEIEHRPNSV